MSLDDPRSDREGGEVAPFVRRFLRASLVWLGVGVLLGFGIAVWPAGLMVIRPAHVHATLLGFVTMMIFGVAYHVIPRFTGAALHSPVLAEAHVWVANLGLVLMVGGWILRAAVGAAGTPALHAGATLNVLSAGLFIYNIWRTLDAAPAPVGRGGRVWKAQPGVPQSGSGA
jgi:hypothetical protein